MLLFCGLNKIVHVKCLVHNSSHYFCSYHYQYHYSNDNTATWSRTEWSNVKSYNQIQVEDLDRAYLFSRRRLKSILIFFFFWWDNTYKRFLKILMYVSSCVCKIKKVKLLSQPVASNAFCLLHFIFKMLTGICYAWFSAVKTHCQLRTSGWNTGETAPSAGCLGELLGGGCP